MIVESYYWKRDLLAHASALVRRRSQRRWREASFASCEKSIMLGFFAIRRLVESRKLSDKTRSMLVSVTMYPGRGSTVTLLNWHKLDKHYLLEAPEKRSVLLQEVSNQAIHSYVFVPALSATGRLDGAFLSSDRKRHQELMFLSLTEIVRCFMRVGQDYPSAMEMKFNPIKRDYEVSAT